VCGGSEVEQSGEEACVRSKGNVVGVCSCPLSHGDKAGAHVGRRPPAQRHHTGVSMVVVW
jgi:hypothetical protein